MKETVYRIFYRHSETNSDVHMFVGTEAEWYYYQKDNGGTYDVISKDDAWLSY